MKPQINSFYIESDKIDNSVVIASLSDLHLCESRFSFDNVEKIIEVLNKINFDYLLLPGDIINDINDLRDKRFCNDFIDIISRLSQGRLTFFSFGNHDKMTKKEGKWYMCDSRPLVDVLSSLPNFIILDNLQHFSLNDKKLLSKGYGYV